MSQVQRIFWTKGPKSTRVHIVDAPTKNLIEGSVTRCGRFVKLNWLLLTTPLARGTRRCRGCDFA